MPFEVNIPEGRCDVCGSVSNVSLRFITRHGCLAYWLSGYTCQVCLDSGKGHDYVDNLEDTKYAEEKEYKTLLDELEKLFRRTNGNPDAEDVEKVTNLLDELDKNQKDRDQLEMRFIKIRNDIVTDFGFEYGPGVEDKHCQICGCESSYLCVVQSSCDNRTHIWDHLSGWFCLDCVITGIMDTHIEKELCELLTFMKEWQDVREKYEFFESVIGKSQFTEKEIKSYVSTYKHRKELGEKKVRYDRRAEYLMYDRLGYEYFEPVMFVIEPAKLGDTCLFCDETYGKNFKCEDYLEHS